LHGSVSILIFEIYIKIQEYGKLNGGGDEDYEIYTGAVHIFERSKEVN